MTTLESSSLVEVESTMDVTIISPKPEPILPKTNKKKRLTIESNIGGGDGDGDDDTEKEDCDVEVWDTLSKSFRQVQAVLDQNRNLIQRVNENHQSMIPDNLAKNVPLIHEINENISEIISIYSDLSVNFSNAVRERRRIKKGSSGERSDS